MRLPGKGLGEFDLGAQGRIVTPRQRLQQRTGRGVVGNRVQRSGGISGTLFSGDDGIIAAGPGEYAVEGGGVPLRRLGPLREVNDPDGCKAFEFSHKGQQFRGDGTPPGWIPVEPTSGHGDVFRIGRFHDEQPARCQHPPGFGHHGAQLIEGNVFDKTKRGNDRLAVIGKGLQTGQGVRLVDAQAMRAADGDHSRIHLDTLGLKADFLHQLQPFAKAAPHVEDRHPFVSRGQRPDKGQIEAPHQSDGVPRTEEAVSENRVEIIRHERHSSM